MDAGFAVAVMALVLFLFGIVSGVGLGDELSRRCVTKREYGFANAGVLLVGALVSSVVLVTGLPVLMGLVIGLMAGAIAGLELGGPGGVRGPVEVRRQDLPRQQGPAEARRGREGAPRRCAARAETARRSPRLVGVQQDGPASKGAGQPAPVRRRASRRRRAGTGPAAPIGRLPSADRPLARSCQGPRGRKTARNRNMANSADDQEAKASRRCAFSWRSSRAPAAVAARRWPTRSPPSRTQTPTWSRPSLAP